MTLKINLPQGAKTWRPGDRVAGSVSLTISSALHIQQISIKLEGHTLSELVVFNPNPRSGNPVYLTQIKLFEKESILFQGPYTLKANNYDWPFEITLPVDCSGSRGTNLNGSHGVYDNRKTQQLPPSSGGKSEKFKSSGNYFNISYELTTSLTSIRGKLGSSHDEQCAMELKVLPYRRIRSPEWSQSVKRRNYECRSLELNPYLRRPSIKDKLTRKPVCLPMAAFQLVTRLPGVAVIGRPIPITIGLEHQLQHSTITSIPAVMLKSFTASLESRIWIRGLQEPKHGHENQWLSSVQSSWVKSEPFATWKGSLPLPEILDLREHLSLSIPFTKFPPTFRTFNVCVRYCLHIEVLLECARQLFRAIYSEPLLLLADHPDEEAVGSEPPIFRETVELEPFGTADMIDIPPPVFEDIVAASTPTTEAVRGSSPPAATTNSPIGQNTLGTRYDGLPSFEAWIASSRELFGEDFPNAPVLADDSLPPYERDNVGHY